MNLITNSEATFSRTPVISACYLSIADFVKDIPVTQFKQFKIFSFKTP